MWAIVAVAAAGGIHLGWMNATTPEPVPTLGELVVGDVVHVRRVGGQRISGAIEDASPMGLTIIDEGRPAFVAADDVLTVSAEDPVMNGALLGVAAGVALGAAASRKRCPDEAAVCGALVSLGLTVGGGVFGAAADAGTHATLYRRPPGAQVRVAPLVSPAGWGARLSVAW